MAFFFSDNPIALVLALVVVIAVLRCFLGTRKWFKGDKLVYLLPVLLIVALILIVYTPLLKILSFSIPFFALIVVFLFGIGGLFFALGMKSGIWSALKSNGPLRVAVKIGIICILALGASNIYGEKLLEEKSVSIADAIMPAEEPVDINLAPIFTKQALGLIVFIVIIGLAFVFVNVS